jgi:hypothetical protein
MKQWLLTSTYQLQMLQTKPHNHVTSGTQNALNNLKLKFHLESELLYDWRFTANQFVLATSPLRPTTSIFLSTRHLRSLSLRNIISDEKMGLSFTIAPGPRQRSHYQVRVPRDSWPYFTVSDSRLLQPGGPGPRIYIPQEEGGPVIPPGTGFPFRRVLRLTGQRWRYSTPPPHGSKFHPHNVRVLR